MTDNKMVPVQPVRTVYGDGRIFHVHTCPVGPHTWKCDSSYCEIMDEHCPDHGGPVPIVRGREPWRGVNR